MGHHRHQIASLRMRVDDIIHFAVDASVNRMDETIAPASFRLLQECSREYPLPPGCKGHIDWVIHSAYHYGFSKSAARFPTENVRRSCHQRWLAFARVRLLRERSLAPIDPAVWTEIWTVQIVCTVGERLALEPFFTLIGDTVAIGVGKFPDAGRCRNI